jgi:hypothetical protein
MRYEKPLFAERRHQNGGLATVNYNPAVDRFLALGTLTDLPYCAGEAATLEEAKRIADAQSGCRQPCGCPDWEPLSE